MNNLVRKLFTVSLMAVLCSGFLYVENPAIHSLGVLAVRAEEVTPYAQSIVWRYKFINGVLHKRLYNESTGQWIGDWIPV